ncbi:c-type cytochrome [Lewinella cohaerens]|uniref:c-type cytochrome n=1 Tax=Lewinella cohaerens TaxID=70995 RepID=UPI001469BB01|nr:cytochrome c [Lewinella cohaerens]
MILITCALFLLLACEAEDKMETEAFQNIPSDQRFTINGERDTILFGEEGVRLFLPANSFTYANGDLVTGEVEIVLVEALSLADQLLMGAAGEKQLGVIRLEAKKENKELSIKAKAKILLQFPAKETEGEFSIYLGKVRRNGKIRWKEGEKAASFLIPEAFSNLPFHPKEFAEELTTVLPFGQFKGYSVELADSLYFSFSGGEMIALAGGFQHLEMNEPYYHRHHVLNDGQYTAESYDSYQTVAEEIMDEVEWPVMETSCGIDPLKVQALKSADFANSLLATSAFAERLAMMLSIGDESLLDIYLNNLDQDLWETDQQAATYLRAKSDSRADQFSEFAAQGLTNTEGGAAYADLLRETLVDRMAQFEEQLSTKRQEIRAALAAKNKEVEILKEEYRQILWKREEHRMRYLTFELGDLGWYWPRRIVRNATDTVFLAKLEAKVPNGVKYDELYLYNVMPYARSIYRLNSVDGELFYPGVLDEKRMYQRLHQAAKVVAVGYKNGKLFIGETNYQVGYENNVELYLKPSSRRRLKALMDVDTEHLYENRISVDLPYMRALHREQLRQNKLWEEQYALYFLGAKAYPNCNEEPTLEEAKSLFAEHCANCHSIDLKTKLTGPALFGGPQEYTKMWFTRFTENSQHMIATGDPRAMEQWRQWGPTIMNAFAGELNKAEISAIFKYIQSVN